jgi:hypothetical protein
MHSPALCSIGYLESSLVPKTPRSTINTSSSVPTPRTHLRLPLLLTVCDHRLAITIRLHQVLPGAVVEREDSLVFARVVLALFLQAARGSWT